MILSRTLLTLALLVAAVPMARAQSAVELAQKTKALAKEAKQKIRSQPAGKRFAPLALLKGAGRRQGMELPLGNGLLTVPTAPSNVAAAAPAADAVLPQAAVNPPAADAVELSAFEQGIVERTNQERLQRGLPPLAVNAQLVSAARLHAAAMARCNRLSHVLPAEPYPSLDTRIAAVGYPARAAGENIAYNTPDAESAVRAWMHSSGHRANILEPTFREIGVGIAYNSQGQPYVCQVFGLR